VQRRSPRIRLDALLRDLHLWIPLGSFVAGVWLLRWLA
jgi:hypothetical protein